MVLVKCDGEGNIDVEDLISKVEKYGDCLVVLMVIYFFIYGVFEVIIGIICDIVYCFGGEVYMDGVNMNV